MIVITANPNSIEFEDQLNQLLKLTKLMLNEIGYVVAVFYRQQAKQGKLFLLVSGKVVVGFCSFNVRKRDGVGVIYEVGTHPVIRGKGGGKMLIEAVLTKCNIITLKCPVDNKSNNFYQKIGKRIGVEAGKKRQLNVWEINHSTLRGQNE